MLLEEIRVSQPEGEKGVVSGLILVLVNDSILHWLVLKVKVKFALEQATKAQMGSRGIALLCVYGSVHHNIQGYS